MITETCSCGACIEVRATLNTMENTIVQQWRENHVHNRPDTGLSPDERADQERQRWYRGES